MNPTAKSESHRENRESIGVTMSNTQFNVFCESTMNPAAQSESRRENRADTKGCRSMPQMHQGSDLSGSISSNLAQLLHNVFKKIWLLVRKIVLSVLHLSIFSEMVKCAVDGVLVLARSWILKEFFECSATREMELESCKISGDDWHSKWIILIELGEEDGFLGGLPPLQNSYEQHLGEL
ncbi:hypothetical protein FCV25MIE_28931 [Fagus crenata]